METQERLYRSQTDKVFGGVAGGLAEYFDIDVVLARVVFVLLALFGGSGGLIYIVLWIAIPKRPFSFSSYSSDNANDSTSSGPDTDETSTFDILDKKPAKQNNTGLIAGVVLILLGVLFLGDKLLPWYNLADLWPLLLVVVGVIMIKPDIFKPSKRQENEI